MKKSDIEIVRDIKKGDVAAFQELYSRYADIIYRNILARVTSSFDADDIFRCRVARRYTGGVDDLRHVAEGSGELRQRLHLRAIRNVRFAKVALHAKLVQLRFCRFHLCEVAPRQHDHGRFSEFLTDRLFPCRRDRLSRP